jgi:hypothetical protein
MALVTISDYETPDDGLPQNTPQHPVARNLENIDQAREWTCSYESLSFVFSLCLFSFFKNKNNTKT